LTDAETENPVAPMVKCPVCGAKPGKFCGPSHIVHKMRRLPPGEVKAFAKLNEAALTVICPQCWAKPGQPCRPSSKTHGVRRTRAQDDAILAKQLAKRAEQGKPACACRNHLGRPKVGYRTRERAVQWALTSKRDIKGMRMEPYRCPTSEKWHMRTAKEPR
jgi:hypothetical protein